MVAVWVAGISIGFMRRLSFFSTNDKFGMSTVHIKCVLCFPPSASSETQVSPCLSEHVKVRLPDESILCKNSSRFTCNTEGISRERRDVLVAVPRISMLIYANRQKIYELLKGGKKPHCVPSMLSVWTGDGGMGGGGDCRHHSVMAAPTKTCRLWRNVLARTRSSCPACSGW